MSVKYVFVTGGVVSGLGKGITAASLGRLLKARGFKVTMQKFDPYINIDPGTMNPIQHGEVFVTDDGAETDLDLGHYERFIDESLSRNSNVTTGKVYWAVLQKERRGDYGGGTVQVIPHITNEIKSRFYRNFTDPDTRIAIIEVGGTVGDIESQPFLESIRQFQHDEGHENAILIHVTLIPYLHASEELKTKPTQASVKDLQGMGIQPDIIVCRSEHPLDQGIKDKIALFCNVPSKRVLQNLDVECLYEAPLAMEKEQLAQAACECLHLECPEPDLTDWEKMVEDLKHPTDEVTVALVGKYVSLHDAYISVVEALKHGGITNHTTVNIKWIDSETVTKENAEELLADVNGILVQLPLPAHIREERVIRAIDPKKDVDGFHPQNVGALCIGQPGFVSCTPAGIIQLLRRSGVEISGRECVILGRSNIVGKPMSLLMLRENATVTIAHSRTENLREVTRRADILIAAVGKPKMITREYVKEGAVVIDVGINRSADGKLCGDVNFEDVEPVCSAITPVPGGVGPMTIAMLLHNCLESVNLQL